MKEDGRSTQWRLGVHAGRSSPEDCQEAGGGYCLPAAGSRTCQDTIKYIKQAKVAQRIARRLEEDSVSPQVGRKHVRYRDQGELHVGWSSPKD